MSSIAQTAEGEKILIVDDDPGLSSLLERFFTSKGYRARAVANVEQMDRLLAREVKDDKSTHRQSFGQHVPHEQRDPIDAGR